MQDGRTKSLNHEISESEFSILTNLHTSFTVAFSSAVRKESSAGKFELMDSHWRRDYQKVLVLVMLKNKIIQ